MIRCKHGIKITDRESCGWCDNEILKEAKSKMAGSEQERKLRAIPEWVDMNKFVPPVKLTHAHTLVNVEPHSVGCPSGQLAWPPGKHTYGGDLIPCQLCGNFHNVYNFNRKYYPEVYEPRHTAFLEPHEIEARDLVNEKSKEKK